MPVEPEEKEIKWIAKLIAAIQPNYAQNREDVLKIIKTKYPPEKDVLKEMTKKILAAADIAKPKEPAVWEHNLVYDLTAVAPLEPVYFWLLDFLRDLGYDTEKIIDNFAASPGSGYFADLVGRQTKMQEEGMKIMATIGTMVRSLINLLYDLKEFEIRLKQYELASSKKPEEKDAGILSLKQIWMDKVDIQRGRGSINAMAYELGFATLRDAFMALKEISDVDRMDINDRVKRVLKPRFAEFLEWKERSEKELKKRYEIERNWIKSQVKNIQIYSRWAKPYLKAAEELMMKEKGRTPELVKAWQMIMLELCLLGKQEIKVAEEADKEFLPKSFRNLKMKRKYYACILIDFVFRGIPAKNMFSGRADINFKTFALNEDELKVLDKALEKSDFEDALKMVNLVTEESIGQLADEIEHFVGEGKEEKKKPKVKKLPEIWKESYEESVVRKLAEQRAAEGCFKIYDIFKKSNGMASFVEPEFIYPPAWRAQG